MRNLLIFICIFAVCSIAADKELLCPAVQKCLNITLEQCSTEDLKPHKKIKYDSAFCAPFIEISKRGLDPRSAVGNELYAKLGSEYRVIYEYKGSLPATKNMMAFLFDYMPFTAKLVNAYQGENYELHYNSKDQKTFSGTNGRSLSGDFIWALQDSAGTKKLLRNVFLGYGKCHILRWDLQGIAVAYLDMDPNTKGEMNYKLTAIVFPANSVLNSIMQMDLFRKVVNTKLDHIVKDVVGSAKTYAKGDKKPIVKSKLFTSPRDQELLKLFEEVVAGRNWELGDALKQSAENKPNITIKTNDDQILKEGNKNGK